MRKILLFSLAFFAITLQAKELVHEFNLGPDETQFDPYSEAEKTNTYDASTKTYTAGAWCAGQIWLENFDATKYYQLVLELTSHTQPLNMKVEYGGGSSQEYLIPAGQTTGIIDLNQHIIKKIELKNWSESEGTFVFSRLYLTGQSGKKYEEVLDNTEHNVGAWAGSFNIDASKFAHAHAGAQLVFNYATNSEATEKWFQLQTKSGEAFLEGNVYALKDNTLNVNEGSTQHIITLTANDVTNLKAYGLAVNGHELTINSITLNYWDENIEVLWTGNQTVSEWGTAATIESSAFTDAKQGDRIVCLVTTTGGAQAQIKYTDADWGWHDLNACQDISGTTYKQMLTQELITSIVAGHHVHIEGKNYTITAVELHAYTGPSEVWTDTQEFDGSWGTNIELNKDNFAGIEAGYHVQLSVTSMTEGGCAMVQSDWLDLVHDTKHIFTAADVEASNIVIDIELQPSDVESILAHGLIVKGVNYTLTKVEVIPNLPSSNIMKHDLEISEAGMATIMLPYYVPALPEGMKAYTLTMVGDYISASEVTTIMPDQAVLIVAPQGEYTLISAENVSDAISGKEASYTNGALVGMYQKGNVPNSSAPTYNYVLQNEEDEGVGFYQVQSDDIAINPYRAYLTCGYNSQVTLGTAPLRIIFHESGTTAIKNVATDNRPNKVVRNGRLYIQHDNQLYTIHGQKIQ